MLKKFAESVAKSDAGQWTAGQGKATRPIADPRRPGYVGCAAGSGCYFQ